MAIKIRKPGEKTVEEEVEESAAAPMEELDQFLVTGTQSVGWATENQNMVLMAVVAILVVSVAVVFFMDQAKQGRMEDAKVLVEAVDTMEATVGDEKPLDLNPTAKPTREGLSFPTYEAKYTELGKQADTYLGEHPSGDGVGLARLMKARSSFELGNFTDATRLYQEWLTANPAAPGRAFVLQALATTQAAEGKVEEAIGTLDKLVALDQDAYGEYAAYQKGVFYEAAGDKAKAKGAFEAMVEKFPEGNRLEMARMRIDLM